MTSLCAVKMLQVFAVIIAKFYGVLLF